MCKYADDTKLLVPEKSYIGINAEFHNIRVWAMANKISLNSAKTKQIIFRRPNGRQSVLPTPLPDLEEVDSIKLLRYL